MTHPYIGLRASSTWPCGNPATGIIAAVGQGGSIAPDTEPAYILVTVLCDDDRHCSVDIDSITLTDPAEARRRLENLK